MLLQCHCGVSCPQGAQGKVPVPVPVPTSQYLPRTLTELDDGPMTGRQWNRRQEEQRFPSVESRWWPRGVLWGSAKGQFRETQGRGVEEF